MPTVHGTMTTDRPERYAEQLVRHWAERGPVTTEEGATVQRWDTGQVVVLRPVEGVLEVDLTVAEGDDAARFAQAVKERLERLAGRSEASVVWHV